MQAEHAHLTIPDALFRMRDILLDMAGRRADVTAEDFNTLAELAEEIGIETRRRLDAASRLARRDDDARPEVSLGEALAHVATMEGVSVSMEGGNVVALDARRSEAALRSVVRRRLGPDVVDCALQAAILALNDAGDDCA